MISEIQFRYSDPLELGFEMSSIVGGFWLQKQTNNDFNSIFRPLPKINMFLKLYSESPFYRDVKHGLEIEFSCRNDKEIKRWDKCKICDTEAGGEAAGVTSSGINKVLESHHKKLKMAIRSMKII